jgi:hypothetical protein
LIPSWPLYCPTSVHFLPGNLACHGSF